MNVIILGGNGYIGSFLKEYLTQKGITTTVYGSRSEDYNLLESKFLRKFDYIVLLAGHSSVNMCVGDLSSPWNNNVRNFNNLIKKLDYDQKLIYASSSSVYGNQAAKEYSELDINLSYINNYDLTKITVDLLANNFIQQGRNIIGFRFGTVNGPSNIIRKDLMINSMIWSAMFEKHIKVSNKHVNRPILGIKDLARAMHTVITNNFYSGIYNLGSFNISVGEVAQQISHLMSAPIINLGDSITYDFKINCDKFCSTYNFSFKDCVEDIAVDVIKCYNSLDTKIVARDKYYEYRD